MRDFLYWLGTVVLACMLVVALAGVRGAFSEEVQPIPVCGDLQDARDLMEADKQGTLEGEWDKKVAERKCGDRSAPWYMVEVVEEYDNATHTNILAHIKIQGRTKLWDAYVLIAGEPLRKAQLGITLVHDIPGIPPANQSWYQNAETNPEARKTFPFPWNKCCNHAELIPVKDIIFPTQSHGWQWNDKGDIKNIPNVIIHWSEAAPDNQPTLFVYNNVMTCFYPPQGGV